MGKNYKRHAQGRGFRRTDIGDMGIRAHKEQQNRIINALKLQNKQQQEYSNEYKRDIEGNAAQELQHNRELKNLKDDVFDVAMDNTRIRAEREIESLDLQAKEAGKKSDFWKDFSTTYSQQYAKAAAGISDVITTKQAEAQVQAIQDSDEWDVATRQVDTLNKLSSYEQVAGMTEALQDKNLSREERRDILSHFTDLGFRMNSKAQDIIVGKLLKQWEIQHSDLAKMAGEHNVGLTHRNIQDYYFVRRTELLQQLGISPTSPAGKKLIDGINDKLADKMGPLMDSGKAVQDTHDLDQYKESAANWVGVKGSEDAYYSNQNARILASGGAYRFDKNKQVIKPPEGQRPNMVENWEVIAEEDIKAGHFNSLEQAKTYLLYGPTPGSEVIIDENGSEYTEIWGDRHKGLEGKLEEIWTEYSLSQEKADNDNLKVRGKRTIDEIKERIKSGDINVTDNNELENLKEGYKDLVHADANVNNFISDYQVFNQNDKDNNIVNMNLYDTYADLNQTDLNEYISFLDPIEQEHWKDRQTQITELTANGYGKKDIRRKAKDILYGILDVDASTGDIKGYDDMLDAIEQDILFEYAAVSDSDGEGKLNAIQKLDQMNERIQKKIDANSGLGQGIYRRDKASGLKTKFLAFEVENDKSNAGADKTQIENAIDEFGFDAVLQTINTKNDMYAGGQILLKDKKTIVNLIATDAVDSAIKSLKAGGDVGYHPTVSKLVESQGVNKIYNERDIWNLYFKSKGLNYFIAPDSKSLADWKATKSLLTIPKKNYSNEDLQSIASFAEGVDLGLWDALNISLPKDFYVHSQLRSEFNPYTTYTK